MSRDINGPPRSSSRPAYRSAMSQAGVDISVIALWLGHEGLLTTLQYVQADLAMKERALARIHEPDARMRRYRPLTHSSTSSRRCDYEKAAPHANRCAPPVRVRCTWPLSIIQDFA